MIRLIAFFLLLNCSMMVAQLNLIGYPSKEVTAVMKQWDCKFESEKPFGDKATMWSYNDPKMPLKYVYLINKSDKMCFGFSITALKKDKKYMDGVVDYANKNFKKINETRWIQTRGEETFTWWLTETRDKTLDVMIIKEKNQ